MIILLILLKCQKTADLIFYRVISLIVLFLFYLKNGSFTYKHKTRLLIPLLAMIYYIFLENRQSKERVRMHIK